MRAGCTWAQAPLALLLTARLLPAPGGSRVAARALFRSPAPDVAAALQADMPALLAELFAGSLVPGVDVQALPHAPAQLAQVPPALARALGAADEREEPESGPGGLEAAISGQWQRIRAAAVRAQ